MRTKILFVLSIMAVLGLNAQTSRRDEVQVVTSRPLSRSASQNVVLSNPSAAAENPVAYRSFSDRPTAVVGGLVDGEKPKATVWGDVQVEEDMPENFPLTLSSLEGERTATFVSTHLSVKQTYRARFDNYRSQLFDIAVPVYYDDRFLMLNASDQRLLSQLESELNSLLTEMDALSERAVRLSQDLASLYKRGRPMKLLKDYTPLPGFGDIEVEASSAFEIPLDTTLNAKIVK